MPREEAARAIAQWRELVERPYNNLLDARRNVEEFYAQFPVPADVHVEQVTIGKASADWLATQGADAHRVVLYLHGGAYVLCSAHGYREMTSRIARAAGARTLVLDYRLAPENPFPAGLQDAVAAYRWLLEQGVAPASIVIAGDSAGGGLTLATLVSLRDAGVPLPSGAVCISPWIDLECTGATMETKAEVDPLCTKESLLKEAAVYLAGENARHPLASPFYADLRGLPPLLIQVGSEETLLEDGHRLERRAKSAGVAVELQVFEGMPHVWHVFASYLPEAQEAIDRIGEFARQRTRAADSARV
ncbi:MAG TPA: alpha/beta hydrolase [Candidatus Acidoferrales bacterium]|nr:alpha/beta hydrolase [Candidatus Acidoferrales bacterium]